MSLYEDRFDTDWDTLDRDEAMERAFALGVAAALGDRNRDEFEAIHAAMGTNYDASIVELAYREGKNKAAKRERDAADADPKDVFEFVVGEELDGAPPPDRDDDDEEEQPRATDRPSVVDGTEATEFPDRDPEQTDFPDFLE